VCSNCPAALEYRLHRWTEGLGGQQGREISTGARAGSPRIAIGRRPRTGQREESTESEASSEQRDSSRAGEMRGDRVFVPSSSSTPSAPRGAVPSSALPHFTPALAYRQASTDPQPSEADEISAPDTPLESPAPILLPPSTPPDLARGVDGGADLGDTTFDPSGVETRLQTDQTRPSTTSGSDGVFAVPEQSLSSTLLGAQEDLRSSEQVGEMRGDGIFVPASSSTPSAPRGALASLHIRSNADGQIDHARSSTKISSGPGPARTFPSPSFVVAIDVSPRQVLGLAEEQTR
jgi:hypothetical protein